MGIDSLQGPEAQPPLSEAQRVTDVLTNRFGKRVRNLVVSFNKNEDGLILKGQTATFHAKQQVQHAAMDISSLPIVANQIEVE